MRENPPWQSQLSPRQQRSDPPTLQACIEFAIPMVNSSPVNAWFYWRYLVSLILGIAATVKVFSFIQIISGHGLLASPAVLLTAIGIESMVAVYVILGEPIFAWMTTIVTFSLLAVAAAIALATGQQCNCMGSSLGPGVMLPLDLAILAGSIRLRPRFASRWCARSLIPIAVSILAAGAMVGLAGYRHRSAVNAPALEFLLAKTTIGKPWPLDNRFHPTLKQLSSGKWMVLVARADCDHCHELIQNYFANPRGHRPEERTAIFMANAGKWQFQFDQIAAKLESPAVLTWDRAEPFVASPAIFLLDNGIVVDASDGKETGKLIGNLHAEFVRP